MIVGTKIHSRDKICSLRMGPWIQICLNSWDHLQVTFTWNILVPFVWNVRGNVPCNYSLRIFPSCTCVPTLNPKRLTQSYLMNDVVQCVLPDLSFLFKHLLLNFLTDQLSSDVSLREFPIPLCRIESPKNIWPFHASRIIIEMFSSTSKNQGNSYFNWRSEGVKLLKFDFSVAYHVCRDRPHGKTTFSSAKAFNLAKLRERGWSMVHLTEISARLQSSSKPSKEG